MSPKASKIKFQGSLKETIEKAIREIGGLSNYIKKGETVLLKPNFNTADPYPASTDLSFLKAVVELVLENGAGSVIIGDSSTMTASTEKVMETLNIFSLKQLSQRVDIHNFDKYKWVKRKVPDGKYLKKVSVPEILNKVDKLIFLPCLKTHYIAKFTGSLKLAVGFMRPRERVALHLGHVQEKVAELNTLFKPDLVIMDARICFISGGPSKGVIREPGIILASSNRVLIDIEGVKIIQSFKGNSLQDICSEDLPQIKLARELHIT